MFKIALIGPGNIAHTYADALEEMGYTVVKKLLVYIQQDELKIIHL